MLLFSWQKCVYIIHGATFYIHMITYHDQSVCSFTYIRSYSFISFLFFCKKCRYLYVIAVGIEFRWSTRSDGGISFDLIKWFCMFPWKDEELLQSFEVFLRVSIVEYCCVVFALPHARLKTNLRTLILLKVGVWSLQYWFNKTFCSQSDKWIPFPTWHLFDRDFMK